MATTTSHRPTEPARTLISRTRDGQGHDFDIWADIEVCDHPHNTARLRFQTQWNGGRDPEALHNKVEFYLDATGLDNLRRLLGAQ